MVVVAYWASNLSIHLELVVGEGEEQLRHQEVVQELQDQVKAHETGKRVEMKPAGQNIGELGF